MDRMAGAAAGNLPTATSPLSARRLMMPLLGGEIVPRSSCPLPLERDAPLLSLRAAEAEADCPFEKTSQVLRLLLHTAAIHARHPGHEMEGAHAEALQEPPSAEQVSLQEVLDEVASRADAVGPREPTVLLSSSPRAVPDEGRGNVDDPPPRAQQSVHHVHVLGAAQRGTGAEAFVEGARRPDLVAHRGEVSS